MKMHARVWLLVMTAGFVAVLPLTVSSVQRAAGAAVLVFSWAWDGHVFGARSCIREL